MFICSLWPVDFANIPTLFDSILLTILWLISEQTRMSHTFFGWKINCSMQATVLGFLWEVKTENILCLLGNYGLVGGEEMGLRGFPEGLGVLYTDFLTPGPLVLSPVLGNVSGKLRWCHLSATRPCNLLALPATHSASCRWQGTCSNREERKPHLGTEGASLAPRRQPLSA